MTQTSNTTYTYDSEGNLIQWDNSVTVYENSQSQIVFIVMSPSSVGIGSIGSVGSIGVPGSISGSGGRTGSGSVSGSGAGHIPFPYVSSGDIGTLTVDVSSIASDLVIGGVYENHKNKARPSTRNKHEEGLARAQRDTFGGEKGDKRRKPRKPQRKPHKQKTFHINKGWRNDE